MSPPRYPSDLSDEEWLILAPLLSSTEKRGRPPKWPLRHVADAVFYLLCAAYTCGQMLNAALGRPLRSLASLLV